MKIQFKVTYKNGAKVVSEVLGRECDSAADMTLSAVTEKVIETEQFMEKLTGLRCHIEQVR